MVEHSLRSCIHEVEALTVDLIGALSDLDDVAVRVTDVAADLAVLGDRFDDELGASSAWMQPAGSPSGSTGAVPLAVHAKMAAQRRGGSLSAFVIPQVFTARPFRVRNVME